MRVESEKESVGADGSLGWIHRLKEAVPVERDEREKQPPMSSEEVTVIAQTAYRNAQAPRMRESLAERLGVSVASLDALRVGYGCDRDGRPWSSWPSRDAEGRVIGITRRYETGEKKTLFRTRTGLFYPAERSGLRGPILIVEGGSDVAAALTVGVPAIGRPSNTGGAGWIRQMIGTKAAVVIGENDLDASRRGGLKSCPADCAGCGHCWPGRFGAVLVAQQLERPWAMPPAGVKDLRELVTKGGSWWELIRELGR